MLFRSSVDAAPAPAKQPLTNEELVQKAAEKAEKAIGGSDKFAGTEKHKYAEKLLERYQGIHEASQINAGGNVQTCMQINV